MADKSGHMTDERKRLAALHALDILGAPREPALDRIAHLVRMEFGARHAGIMLVDRISACYIARDNITIKSTPRNDAFCNITIQHDEPLIIPDTRADARVRDNPYTLAGIRSYGGVPLRTREGYNIGALCVFDSEPLTFPPIKVRKMKELARLAMDCIELRRLAVQDHLTGALNRRGFLTEVDRELARPDQSAEPMTLALMDLDHFKQINDRFGHPAGDRVLQSVAGLANGEGLGTGIIGRLGGEEFGILLPGHTEISALPLIDRLRQAIAAIRLPDLPDLRVTASFGLAETGPKRRQSTALMAQADAALYEAKASGRNTAVLSQQLPGPVKLRAH